MSRIGKLPIEIPEKVEVLLEKNTIKTKGPLWELSFSFSDLVSVKKEENILNVKPLDDSKEANTLWWTTRSIINNMVEWVSKGYKKSLEINWVWYKFEVQWNKIVLSIWYSHKVDVVVPTWLKAELDQKQKNILHISWIDKQFVWQFASKIKALKKPEPYKWKWIKYVWEYVRRKAWKTGSK